MLFNRIIDTTHQNEDGSLHTTSVTEQVLFKDKGDINHRNPDSYLGNIWLLAGLLRTKVPLALLDFNMISGTTPHIPEHNGCAGLPAGDSGRPTEKRMCRCMCYYDESKDICKNCVLKEKWNNVGTYKIVDYEVPMSYVVPTVGGIDLVIEGPDKGQYTTEVKPQNSRETLIRMIAEALTYREAGGVDRYPNAKPAICFFRENTYGALSEQAKDFLNPLISEDPAFQYLLSLISVFYITTETVNGVVNFTIHNHAEDPLA